MTDKQRPRGIPRLALALALLVLLAAALAPAFAQGGPPAQPPVPNDEPAELSAEGTPIWMLEERAAVEATLAAYFAAGQFAPPEGALLELPELATLSDAELSAVVTRVYLPLVRRQAELGQLPPTVTPTPVTPTPETPTPAPVPGADVAVTIWPKPSIWVARGGLLEYEIRLKNSGRSDATETKVVFPFNPTQVAVERTSLDSRAGDWVSDGRTDRFTVTFGRLRAGQARSGKLFVRVGANLAYATLLDVRASYSWRDGADGGGQRSNWTPVLVGSGPSDAPYIWVQVAPDRGVAGTWHRFFTNRFLPGEPVSTWLNTPQGVRPLTLRGTANGEGSVTLDFTSAGLARGNYQLVLYGQRSGLTGVAGFVVQ